SAVPGMTITSTAALPFVMSRGCVRAHDSKRARRQSRKNSENRTRAGPKWPRPRHASSCGLESDASSAEQLHSEDDERQHEQEVDQATNRRQRHDAKEPEDEKHENDCPKHDGGTSFCCSRHARS